MVRKVLLVICLLATLPVHAATPEEMIKAQANAWVSGFNAGDAKALGSIYTADGWLLPPNAEAVKGPDAIAAFMAPFFSAGEARVSITIDTTALSVHGEEAHRVGTWAIRTADGTVVDKGKYIEIWKKSGERWLMTHDIWNSDMPATPAPAP